jgi:hypothetical protein
MPSAQLPYVKTEIVVIEARCIVPIKTAKSDLLDFDVDLAKVSAMVGEENTLFANIDSPDLGDDDDSASELGDYELAYLHSLYQPADILSNNHQDGSDEMLPDAPASIGAAIAPPSLGTSHLISAFTLPTPPASNASAVSHIAVVRAASPPNTPPRGSQDVWESDNEEEEGPAHAPSSRGATPLPAGPAASKSAPMTPPGKYNATSRKRKAPVHFADSAPSPQTKKRAGAAEEKADARSKKEAKRAAEEAAKLAAEDASDYDSSDSDPSDSLLLDGLEIRPEDDPLGLFQKDPATLTPEEQRIVKKQRRLLKNRESAQLSRHRKKMHLHTLERQVDALKKDKAALAARIAELSDENERIRKLSA